jgi:hypothetical protein
MGEQGPCVLWSCKEHPWSDSMVCSLCRVPACIPYSFDAGDNLQNLELHGALPLIVTA